MADNYDKVINNESEYGNDKVVVKVNVSPYQGFYLPDNQGKESIVSVWNKMTIEDSMVIEKMSFQFKTIGQVDASGIDYIAYRSILFRRNLCAIEDFWPERKNGWIVEKDWNRIKTFNAMILNSMLSDYEMTTIMSEEDEKLIDRQSVTLFGSENGRVANPHPAVSMYCLLSGIWEKFGLDITKIKQMRQEDYSKIRAVMAKESEIMKRNLKAK